MSTRVVFLGFSRYTTQTEIIKFVLKYGDIVSMAIPPDKKTKLPKGTVFVEYCDPKSAIGATQDDNKNLVLDKMIAIRYNNKPTKNIHIPESIRPRGDFEPELERQKSSPRREVKKAPVREHKRRKRSRTRSKNSGSESDQSSKEAGPSGRSSYFKHQDRSEKIRRKQITSSSSD